MNDERQMLRHTVATLAYRGGKVLRDVPETFGSFRAAADARTPGEILAHLGDLFDWALAIARGAPAWRDSPPQRWDDDVARFFAALGAFDGYLASDAPLGAPPERLFQGPVADALTHVGQLAMLRRLAGLPIRSENYFKAEVRSGRVGRDQPAPKREF